MSCVDIIDIPGTSVKSTTPLGSSTTIEVGKKERKKLAILGRMREKVTRMYVDGVGCSHADALLRGGVDVEIVDSSDSDSNLGGATSPIPSGGDNTEVFSRTPLVQPSVSEYVHVPNDTAMLRPKRQKQPHKSKSLSAAKSIRNTRKLPRLHPGIGADADIVEGGVMGDAHIHSSPQEIRHSPSPDQVVLQAEPVIEGPRPRGRTKDDMKQRRRLMMIKHTRVTEEEEEDEVSDFQSMPFPTFSTPLLQPLDTSTCGPSGQDDHH